LYRSIASRKINEVETEQLKRSREMNRKLLQAHILARGTGDVGLQIQVVTTDSEIRMHKRGNVDSCMQQTIFGEDEAIDSVEESTGVSISRIE